MIKVLRMMLSQITEEKRNGLQVVFQILHLYDKDCQLLRSDLAHDINELSDSFAEALPGMATPSLELLEFRTPSAALSKIGFHGCLDDLKIDSDKNLSTTVRMGVGTTVLDDLVELYKTCGLDLFEKNVRYFVTSKKNTKPEGPAGNIKETLRNICIQKKIAPGLFQLYHNGICICCADLREENGSLCLTSPRIVNGCQSVVAAQEFRYDKKYKEKIDKDPTLWRSIRLPVRVIQVHKDELIYEIAMNNNRQNAIHSSALRANDDKQLDLELRFRDIGVFYERQEYEYKTLSQSEAAEDQNEMAAYGNTAANEPVNIEDLAQALAAVDCFFDRARSYSRIFESADVYADVFKSDHIYSVRFLVGLRNVAAALSDTLNFFRKEMAKYEDLSSKYIKWHVLYLLMRHVSRHERNYFLESMCKGTLKARDIEDDMIKLLKRSGIMPVIKDLYIDSENNWREVSESRDLLKKATNKLYLTAVDPFADWP